MTSSVVSLPADIVCHTISGRYLLLAPADATWVCLSEPDYQIFVRLRRGADRQELEQFLVTEGFSQDRGRAVLNEFFGLLQRHSFLKDGGNQIDPRKTRLQAHITNRCNLRCSHCYVSSGRPYPHEIGRDDWLRVLEIVNRLCDEVNLSISGGEPLTVPWLTELLRAAKESYGFGTALLTNGMLCTKKVAEELAPYVDYVAVSLDGATREIHDLTRGAGAFDRAIEGIKNLGAAGIPTILNIVLMQRNKNDLLTNLLPLVKSLPCAVDVDISNYILEGRGLHEPSQPLAPREFQQTLSRLSRPFISEAWDTVPTFRRRNCGYGQSLAIYANGDVSPCLTPRFVRGNILNDGIEAVFARIAGERRRTEVNNLPICRTCDVKYVCGGKCHLTQLRGGRTIGQNECSQAYRDRFYRSLIQHFDIVETSYVGLEEVN